MTQPSNSDIARFQRANLKMLEAKAQLWATLNFVVTVAVIAGLVALVALGFKLVLG